VIKRIILPVVFLLALTAGGAAFFLTTSMGLQAAAFLVSHLSAGRLVIGDSHGQLLGNWRLEHVTIHTDGVDVSIEHLSCTWDPGLLLEKTIQAAQLSAENVVVTLKDQGRSDSEQGGEFVPPHITLPLAIFINSLQVDRLSIATLGGTQLYAVDSFTSRFSLTGDLLEIGEILFTSEYLSGSGEASVTLSGSWPIAMAADVRTQQPGCSDIRGRMTVSHTLSDPQIDLLISDPAELQIDLGVAHLFNAPSFQAVLTGTSVELGALCNGFPDARVDFDLTAGGEINNLRGSAQAVVQLAEVAPVSTQLEFGFDGQSLKIDQGIVGYGKNYASLRGRITLAPELAWDGEVLVDSFDLSDLAPVPLVHVGGRVKVSGSFDGERLAYLADVEELEITADELDLSLGGDLSLAGDQQGLEIRSCRIDCGQGRIDLAGGLDWTDGFQWEAGVRFDEFDPSEIAALPEGSINGSLSSRGRIDDADILVETEINTLTGVLAGYELNGGGNLVYRDRILTIADLNITNGDNRFYATGTVADRFDLNFVFNGAELERILPQLRGTMDVSGVLSGPRSEPEVQVTLKGTEIGYLDNFAGSVAAELDLVPHEMSGRGSLRIANLNLAELQADEFGLNGEGSISSHQLSAELRLESTRLQAEASGSLADGSWQGDIGGLVLSDSRFGSWVQQGRTQLRAAPGQAVLDRFCLASAENKFCGQASWEETKGWSLALDELKLALSSLNDWGIIGQKLDGTISADLQVAGVDTSIVSATASVAVPELEVDLGPNPYYEEFIWYDTQVSFYIQDDDLTASFKTRFVDDSRLSGTISLEDGAAFSANFADLPLQGFIEADLKELAVLSVVTSDFLLPEGGLYANLELNGTLGSPAVEGDVLLQEGELRIPMLGVQLTGVTGTMGFMGRRLELDLSGGSGTGQIRAAGQFDFSREPWQAGLSLSGTEVDLLNRRMITLTADPDLELILGPSGGSLEGRVVVSKALIEVEKIDRSTSESSDVVFVDELSDSSSWPFNYDIDVVLGDQVQVIGHGLTARLEGQLNVASNTTNIAVGKGRLDIVDGSFSVYGSPLNIARGRLSFNGGPVDNPGLDIRASKNVEEAGFGTEGVEVGVNVIGSAADFEMELFAVPSMQDADILAYILLDKPLSREGDESAGLVSAAAEAIGLGKGTKLLSDVSSMLPVDDIRVEGRMESQETSLVVGKNLSEELSVSYDYNLFKNAGSFRVRYQFGKGFSVESRNSLESNAVELLYSLER
jgi:translocation and assembly module TamB